MTIESFKIPDKCNTIVLDLEHAWGDDIAFVEIVVTFHDQTDGKSQKIFRNCQQDVYENIQAALQAHGFREVKREGFREIAKITYQRGNGCLFQPIINMIGKLFPASILS